VDLWTVSPPDLSFAKARDLTWFTGVGRVKAGVSLEQAQANLTTVQADLGREYPKTDKDITVLVKPLKEVTVGAAKSSLWLLFGSVTLLLVIACTNVAALLLARAVSRQHEIAVRFSLGASRATVIAQLLAEAWVLALAGAALGLGVAAGASGVFRSLAKDLPRIDEIGLDWRLVLYTLACAVAATLLCGVFPAIRGTRRNLAGSMAQSGRSRVAGRNPVQFALVGVQVALAVTLLTGAGLLVRSFQALGRVSPGFDPERVLSFRVSSSWGETGDPKAAKQRLHTILEGLRAMTGVEEASTTFGAPGVPTDVQAELKSAEGRAETEPKLVTQIRTVTPAYFATMRIPILSGEVCRDEPNTITMMVNRSFANAYYAGSTPVGRHLLQTANPYLPSGEVRGIVGDAREMGMDHEPAPTAYYCFGSMQPGLYFLVRTRSDPKTLAGTIRRQFHEIEPGRSVYGVAPLVEQISDAYAENRLRTILLVFFATTAVSLACVGLYGTISYLVNVRRREVGLRLALGAMRTQIVRQFVSQGMIVSALGCAVGIGLAAALARLFAGMLYGVSASDATTLGGVVVTVLAVSVLASLLPAIRAARLEPMQVLRDE
jgi:putative ABC transport system permease protein